MEYQHKGNIGIREMALIAFALIATAAYILVWTQGLPIETQEIATNIE